MKYHCADLVTEIRTYATASTFLSHKLPTLSLVGASRLLNRFTHGQNDWVFGFLSLVHGFSVLLLFVTAVEENAVTDLKDL